MHRFPKALLLGMAFSQLLTIAAPAADSGARKEIGDVLVQYTPATYYIWTDKIWYQQGQDTEVVLRWTANANQDPYPYTTLVYLQNIETGERQYVSNGSLGDEVRDTAGNGAGQFLPQPLLASEGMQLVSTPTPELGHWQFVAELRDVTATRVVKRAYAKFVVVDGTVDLGFNGNDVEISEDTTWTSDKVYRIRYQVFVNSGATLTIEPGTVVAAQGQNAVLVIERGGQIMAEGRRELPIVMTCEANVGQRFSGCWAGLIVLGSAPVNLEGEDAIAEGVLPATRPVYGGDDPEESSGVLKYVRVEFAGVDFTNEIQPNAFGFHGVGSGTVIDHIQAHEGEDDGIEFFGGTANMKYFVSDGAKDDSLDWALGWTGNAQFGFVLQDSVEGDNGIEADNNENGFNNEPRSNPKIWNLTMIGDPSAGHGVHLRRGTAATLRNCVIVGFGEFGFRIENDETFQQATQGNLNLDDCLFWNSAGAQDLAGQIHPDALSYVDGRTGVISEAPMMRSTQFAGNPDPRALDAAPLGLIGNAASPPSNGFFDTSASYLGAFGEENWLEEWTNFGAEEDLAAGQ